LERFFDGLILTGTFGDAGSEHYGKWNAAALQFRSRNCEQHLVSPYQRS
jgi:hypothetical protein